MTTTMHTLQLHGQHGSRLVTLIVALAYLYCLGVIGWAGFYFAFHDRWWWLFVLNSFALYFFFPLPVLIVVALLVRRGTLWLGAGVVFALGVYLFGGLLLPTVKANTSDAPTVTVMTYNMLGYNERPASAIAALRESNADIIALQELNPIQAAAIDKELSVEYPHRVLVPQPRVSGMGIISRYPLTRVNASLPGRWVGPPLVVRASLDSGSTTVITFHAIPPTGSKLLSNDVIREREQQMQTLTNFAAAQSTPVIALGDLNATDRSEAYAVATRVFADSWRSAGWGFGHTFPGAASFGSSRPRIFDVPVPKWLIRIDYVFHSAGWRTLDARLGPWDGISDHRPVVAELQRLSR